MSDVGGWRSEEATAYLDDAQRAGFAWEFLRRNPVYRQEFEIMNRQLTSGATTDLEAASALAKRWGLTFPLRSPPALRPCPDPVGRLCPFNGHCAHGIAADHPDPDAVRAAPAAKFCCAACRWAAYLVARAAR